MIQMRENIETGEKFESPFEESVAALIDVEGFRLSSCTSKTNQKPVKCTLWKK